MADWVLVDTCIWASFFSKPTSPAKLAVDSLLNDDQVALIGPIVAEVLMGFRREEQANWVASRLQLSHCVELGWQHWTNAARMGRRLASRGQKLPMTDLVLAAAAQRLEIAIYTVDPHFDLIDNLKRYAPP